MLFKLAMFKNFFASRCQHANTADSARLKTRLCEIEHQYFYPVTDIPGKLQMIPKSIENERQEILRKLQDVNQL